MAEKTIKIASFWYGDQQGPERTALRGDTVDLSEADIKRGERVNAFATDEDLAEGSAFSTFLASRQGVEGPTAPATEPAPVGPASKAPAAAPKAGNQK